MRLRLLLSAGTFLLCAMPALADPTTAAALPVTHVTLYTSGVGYFERGGAIDGDATQTLLFPVGQINDVLKSLVLLDTGGGLIRPVTYAAQDPVGRQLQAFSLDLSDNPDRATLYNRLRGAGVTVTTNETPAKTLTGTIVGVETQTIVLPNNGGTTQQSVLNLLTDDGKLRALPLALVSDVQLTDANLNAEFRQALKTVASGRDTNKRPVTLSFSGKGRRNVLVGYLTETPLWQTSYRLVLGDKPQLQGWAMVQNTSQDDWNSVNLTLVSGRPISFIQDLYTPLYVSRPTVAARVAASPTPQTYNGNLQADTPPPAPSIAAPGSADEAVARPRKLKQALESEQRRIPVDGSLNFVGRADMAKQFAASVQTAGAQLGASLFSYAIKVPVSVPRQQSAMIPFVAGAITAEPVAIFNAGVQADHPLTGARLKNTTGLHLMGGPLTVFDTAGSDTGYVGDALIDDTEPGQTRLISYAVEQAIDATMKPGDGSGQVVAIKIVDGSLIATRRTEQSTVYTFKNNGAKARIVVIEHPDPGSEWKLIEPAKAADHTADEYRFDVPVAPGASQKFMVRQARPESETYGLADSDLGTLFTYSRRGEASPQVKAALEDVLSRRRKMAQTQSAIAQVDRQLQNVSAGQTRIRDNMKALDHGSALYKRYVTELDAQETQINTLQSRKDALSAELSKQRADLNASVATLNVS